MSDIDLLNEGLAGERVVDERGDELVAGRRVIPRAHRLARSVVVIPGHVDDRCCRDRFADPADHRHQLRHRVLRCDRVIQQRRVQRQTRLARQHPGRWITSRTASKIRSGRSDWRNLLRHNVNTVG